jgi:Flp pilus assembly protein TadG
VRRRFSRDRGSVAVEAAFLAPALIAVVALIVVVGRVGNSKLDLDAAAQSAARTISMARSPTSAIAEAERVARATLRVGSPTCREWTFAASTTPTEVTVEISCDVDLSAAAMLPVPGSRTLTSSATEVIDRFRENPGGFGISEGSGSNPRVGGV